MYTASNSLGDCMSLENKFEHGKKWKAIIKRFENRKVNVRYFCKTESIDCSSLYRNLRKYRKSSFDGLIDHRHGTPYKITPSIKRYIIGVKIKGNKMSGADIVRGIKKKFGVEVNRSQINRKLKELGLNDTVGRKSGKPIKKKPEN